MAIWHKIKPSKLKSLSNEFKRCYVQLHGPCLVNHSAGGPKIGVLDKPVPMIRKSGFEFPNNVRFFAAPVHAKPKQEEKDHSGPRLNNEITAATVRLVSDDGHTIVSLREAIRQAMSLKLDLVEVQRTADPPVCKIMDYHREKYKKEITYKDRVKSKSEVSLRKGAIKEVRFSAKTEKKDLEMKADSVKRLMERGYRVKCMATGTEEQDLGGVLARLSALIEDVSVVESGPLRERRQAYSIVRHIKFGPGKKGSSKKAASKPQKNAKPADDTLDEDVEDHSEAEHETPPEFIHQRPVLDSTETVPSLHLVPPPVMEDRYRRGPPTQRRDRNPPITPMEHHRMDQTQQREQNFSDQFRQPQFPDEQRRQPQNESSSRVVNDSPEKPANRYSKTNTTSNSARNPRIRGG